jgi:hypothetical protein
MSTRPTPPRVCLLDLDLQFGSVATYLDLPRKEAVFEFLTDTAAIGQRQLHQGDADLQRQAACLYRARPTCCRWTSSRAEDRAHDRHGAGELRLRRHRHADDRGRLDRGGADPRRMSISRCWNWTCARPRTSCACPRAEGRRLPHEKLRFVLNRAPKFTDLSAKSRVKRMAESLDIDIEVQLARRRQAGDAVERPRPAACRKRSQEPAAQGTAEARQVASRPATRPPKPPRPEPRAEAMFSPLQDPKKPRARPPRCRRRRCGRQRPGAQANATAALPLPPAAPPPRPSPPTRRRSARNG